MLSKKGVSEEAAASLATKAVVSDPKLIDEYAGAKDVDELSDEAKDKLGVGASLTPKEVKNIANKTMEEKGYTDIYGQPESVSLASDFYSSGNKILHATIAAGADIIDAVSRCVAYSSPNICMNAIKTPPAIVAIPPPIKHNNSDCVILDM